MREYTDSEFPWEYREYTKYAKSSFPHAFRDADHFKAEYHKAPLTHLPDHVIANMEYATVGSYMANRNPAQAHDDFSHRRDTKRIEDDLMHGKTAPPIALKHSKGYRILGGNTRMSLAAAHGINLPMKVIDISDRH